MTTKIIGHAEAGREVSHVVVKFLYFTTKCVLTGSVFQLTIAKQVCAPKNPTNSAWSNVAKVAGFRFKVIRGLNSSSRKLRHEGNQVLLVLVR